MPRLILLRHATAERARPGESDHERVLTKGGRKEAKAVGKILAKRSEKVDLVLSSDSRRTRETWEEVAGRIDDAAEVRFLRALYEAHDYAPIIKAEGGAATAILVVGHNPAMHATAINVAEGLSGRDGAKLRAGFPKAALAIFDFEGEWKSLRPGGMRLVAFIEVAAG